MNIEHKKGDEGRFFIKEAGETVAFVDYRLQGNKLIITHTEVSEQLKGTGTARKLVDKAWEYGNSEGYQVIAECSYAAHLIKKYKNE
ncbi:MAG: GNAT family N-acetyltransferase [Candidatus Cyclobacteriaceae bacterium M2_1C_046]